jgi:hypothetical protein
MAYLEAWRWRAHVRSQVRSGFDLPPPSRTACYLEGPGLRGTSFVCPVGSPFVRVR